MDESVIVDCRTGGSVRRPFTPSEETQRVKDTEEHERLKADREEKEAERTSVLSKVAKTAGITVDDLKRALGNTTEVKSAPDAKKAARIKARQAQ